MIFRCDICGKTIMEIKDYDPGCPACSEKLAEIAFERSAWGLCTGRPYYEFRERFLAALGPNVGPTERGRVDAILELQLP